MTEAFCHAYYTIMKRILYEIYLKSLFCLKSHCDDKL